MEAFRKKNNNNLAEVHRFTIDEEPAGVARPNPSAANLAQTVGNGRAPEIEECVRQRLVGQELFSRSALRQRNNHSTKTQPPDFTEEKI